MTRLAMLAVAPALLMSAPAESQTRPRARDLGLAPGIFRVGPHNSITDVPDVRVGQVTVIVGDSVRTGVTAILPHGGNVFRSRVPAAVHVGNGFGKLIGVTQLRELGELETPILLTCTLCVWRAADALAAHLLAQPDMADVRSINVVVGETNDGRLNAIRSRPIDAAHVREAMNRAASGPIAEGSVGAGAGTIAFGWKGGIGTSSRVLPASLGGWIVGVLVQSNFGGVLQMAGAPVGRELRRHSFLDETATDSGDGSIMIVVATNAPLSSRNLERLASRAMLGLGRTGSFAGNGSGDYAIAFSNGVDVRRESKAARHQTTELANEATSALFAAVVEATEEAIYNSILRATTATSNGVTIDAIPIDRVREILARYGIRSP